MTPSQARVTEPGTMMRADSGDIPARWPSRGFLWPSHLRDSVARLVVSGYVRHFHLPVERAKEQTLDHGEPDARPIREIHLNSRGVHVHTSIDRVQRRMRNVPAGALEVDVRRRWPGCGRVAASYSGLDSVRCRVVREVDEPAQATLVVRRRPKLLWAVRRLNPDYAVCLAHIRLREVRRDPSLYQL